MSKPVIRSSLLVATLAALSVQAGNRGGDFPGVFEHIKAADCIPSSNWQGWTFGDQYRDAFNGIDNVGLRNSWSMLARWQGDDIVANQVQYNLGLLTGLQNQPASAQRGKLPEDPNGSPGVQANCYDVGMLINSWETPHRPIVGGGYNDMYGYSWPLWSGTAPRPFTKAGQETHLMLQASIGLNLYSPSSPSDDHLNPNPSVATAQVSFFAYLRDMTNPSLPPIAVIAGAHDTTYTSAYAQTGVVGFDYSNVMTTTAVSYAPQWFPRATSGDGVWFVSGPISKQPINTQPYVDT